MLMKHISDGFDRICGTPVPEQGGYVSDAVWLELPECPVCYEDREYLCAGNPHELPQGLQFLEEVPTLAPQEANVHKHEEQPTIITQGLYLRQYLE
jgi:hypothetical protein